MPVDGMLLLYAGFPLVMIGGSGLVAAYAWAMSDVAKAICAVVAMMGLMFLGAAAIDLYTGQDAPAPAVGTPAPQTPFGRYMATPTPACYWVNDTTGSILVCPGDRP